MTNHTFAYLNIYFKTTALYERDSDNDYPRWNQCILGSSNVNRVKLINTYALHHPGSAENIKEKIFTNWYIHKIL